MERYQKLLSTAIAQANQALWANEENQLSSPTSPTSSQHSRWWDIQTSKLPLNTTSVSTHYKLSISPIEIRPCLGYTIHNS